MSFISRYLALAMQLKASDIHLCEGHPVLARVDGQIVLLENTIPDISKIVDEFLTHTRPEICENMRKSYNELNDICITFDSKEYKHRLRATIYRDENGTCIAVRLIPFKPLTIQELGLPHMIEEICTLNRGLFVVTGASGSGKSTTLASMIAHINATRKSHIITIEDPIEYIIKTDKSLINHREVGRDTKSFSTALHWILREDPNIVVLGELRDVESMRSAIQIAETGHLVLATLHTKNAVSTIDRFIGSFSSEEQQQIRLMLAENLVGVLAQSLIPRIDGGMIGAFELLLNNDAVKNNIREQKIYQLDNVIQMGKRQGMIAMEDYIIELISQGFVSYETAIQYAPSRAKLMDKAVKTLGVK